MKNIFLFFRDNKLFCLIILLAIVLIGTTFRDYGISWDERDSLDYGYQAWQYYLSLGRDKTFFTQIPILEYYASRGPIVELSRQFLFFLFNKNGINFYHFILAFFTLPVFFFIYKTVLLVTNNKLISSLACLFLLLMPRFYGDIYNNSKDVSVGVLLSAIIYFSLLLFRTKNRRVFNLIVLGLLIGLVVSLRAVMGIIALLFLFFYLLSWKLNFFRDFWKIFKVILLLAISSLFSLYLSLPYLHIKPLTGIWDMIKYSSNFPWIGRVLFDGKIFFSTELPWYYLPKWILVTTPIFMFILIFGLLFLFRKNLKNYFEKICSIFVLMIFIVPIILVFVMKPVLYDAWRHFLFLSVPLVILASLGLYFLLDFLKEKKKTNLVGLVYLFIILSLTSVGFSYTKLHPYEYTYFNSFVGELKGAYGKYETDYWGKSFKESIEWLNAYVGENQTTVYACGHPFQSVYYLNPNIKWVSNLKDAEYFVCYTRGDEDKKVSDKNNLYVVKRDGVPLNYVKKNK